MNNYMPIKWTTWKKWTTGKIWTNFLEKYNRDCMPIKWTTWKNGGFLRKVYITFLVQN